MNISTFAKYLEQLDSTTKRLEITQLLADLIAKLAVDETDKAIYLALGYLKAPSESQKFNIADRMMIRILEMTYATTENPDIKTKIEKMYGEKGDLGDVAYELAPDKKDSRLTIDEIYQKLLDVAQTEGFGSQENKAKRLATVLRELDKLSAKYITRIVLGTTRLGFTELTVIAALAQFLQDKNLTETIEASYNIHPDLGLIAKELKSKGIKGIKDIKIETGVPVLSQKAQRVSGMEEAFERIPNVWAEFKFDGTRVQLHMDKNKESLRTIDNQTSLFKSDAGEFLLKTFTRNLEETTHQYPDILEAAKKQINADSVILDGEAIGYNPKTGEFLAFQETIQRKRKYDVAATAKNIPLKYFVFDILYLNGKSLIDEPLEARRKILESVVKKGDVISVAEHFDSDTLEGLEESFELAKSKNLEGIIVKKADDHYQAGARSYSWIKLKKADEKLLADSIDCVLLGYYFGKGDRSVFGIGGFLVGIYDDETDTFKTITKVGTGLKEDDWIKLKLLADKLKIKDIPSNVIVQKQFFPDVTTKPSLVIEIGADEISISPTHSAGYALRFPRLLKFREDKKPTEATTLQEIKKMFENQKKR
jgi:DNA ligase-1